VFVFWKRKDDREEKKKERQGMSCKWGRDYNFQIVICHCGGKWTNILIL
jgi:hypothetical protein